MRRLFLEHLEERTVFAADLGISASAVPVVDPDGAGPLSPVALPVVGPNVPAGSVNAGGYVRYDVPFGNSGPDDAINVLVTDVILGNSAFVGALATGGVFVPAAQPPSVPFTYTVQAVDTVAPLGPNISLTCTVTGAAGSQNIYCRPQGNTGLGAPGPYADGVLPAGYNGTLTFFVKVNESVPGGSNLTNLATIVSGSCPNGVGPVPPIFPPVTCSSTIDANGVNNTSLPTNTVVVASSNLAVSKIVQSAVTLASTPNQTGPIGPATAQNGTATTGTAVVAGTLLTYRITITNNGPSDAANVRVTDFLPSGLETPPGRVLGVKFVSVNPVLPGGVTFTCDAPTGVNPSNNPQGNGGSFVCTAPSMPANAPNNVAAIDVTVFIDPATKASLVNTATVDASIDNFHRPVSGSATLTTPVISPVDLSISKLDTPDPVVAGNELTYTFTVQNNGTASAENVSISDSVPANTTFVSLTQNSGPAFALSMPAVGGGGTVTGTIDALAAGGAATFTLVVRVNSSAPNASTLTNTATVATSSSESSLANNTDTETTAVIAQSDLIVDKTGQTFAIAGDSVTYTITLTNSGPSDSQNVSLTDMVPAGTTFLSAAQASGPAFTLITPPVGGTGAVTATIATLPGGAQATFTLVVNATASSGTVVVNTAAATTTSVDVNLANNSDSESSLVVALSSATIVDDPANPGQKLLLVVGTNGSDVLLIEPRPSNTLQIRVRNTGQLLGIFTSSQFQRILAFGLGGNDVLIVDSRINKPAELHGNEGNDKLIGGSGSDRLFGETGSDSLTGGSGTDALFGGSGDDTLLGGNGNDQLFGEGGSDVLKGESGNDLMLGGVGNDNLFGGNGRDVMIGGENRDRLFGQAGDDILIGGTTTHDADTAALLAILAEWAASTSFNARIAGLGAKLNAGTVLDDGTVDDLTGDSGRDWYLDFALADNRLGFSSNATTGDRRN